MNTNPYTIYHVSDTQKELLHKIQDYLIEKDYIESVSWVKGTPPVYYKVSHPIQKLYRILRNGYYDERDKKGLNGLREFYILSTRNVDKSPYYEKRYEQDENGWYIPVDL